MCLQTDTHKETLECQLGFQGVVQLASNFCRTVSWESRIPTQPGSSELDHCTRVDCGITEEAKLSYICGNENDEQGKM